MILLHLHSDSEAQMGADSPWGVPPAAEAPPTLLPAPDEDARLSVEEEEGPSPVGVVGGWPLPWKETHKNIFGEPSHYYS